MDVVEAIMAVFSDILGMTTNVSGNANDIITNVVTGIVQGIMAMVQTIQNIFGALQG